MNWFQIVFLREQSQAPVTQSFVFLCCELISNCIFTWAITSKLTSTKAKNQLWIDFKLYFYVSNHKPIFWLKAAAPVVNWFQIVFLREQSQVKDKIEIMARSCELISNCIFTWAITRQTILLEQLAMLWIDFKLYFYVSNHKIISYGVFLYSVVNWFQIVFLREQSQDLLML